MTMGLRDLFSRKKSTEDASTALVRAEEERSSELSDIADRIEAENVALRERVAELEAGGGGMIQLVTDNDPRNPASWSTRARITQLLGIATRPGAEASDEGILEAIERLRGASNEEGAGALAKRNETLAEATQANRMQRQELDDRLTQSKDMLNRLGAILGVQRVDGEEIIERAQRFSTFHYWLKKRLVTLRDRVAAHFPPAVGEDPIQSFAAYELRAIIAALVGDAALAKLIQGKSVTVSKTVLDLAENRPAVEPSFVFRHDDIVLVLEAFDAALATSPAPGRDRTAEIARIFLGLRSAGVSSDFVDFMNAIVIPALARISHVPKVN